MGFEVQPLILQPYAAFVVGCTICRALAELSCYVERCVYDISAIVLLHVIAYVPT